MVSYGFFHIVNHLKNRNGVTLFIYSTTYKKPPSDGGGLGGDRVVLIGQQVELLHAQRDRQP